MAKTFLFITALTPKRLMTPLRALLFEQFLLGLKNQEYPHWQAILIGEETRTDGNIHYLSVAAESKELKLIFAKEYIHNLKVKPDYIIRLDDDDIINPFILKRAASLSFDCYADQFHAFYDIASGKISLQKRNFLANSVIHKYEHAMMETGEDRIPLLQCEHSIWAEYYRDKNILYAPKKSPVYLRILSPTTVTNGIFGATGEVSKKYNDFKNKVRTLTEVGAIDFKHYSVYLKSHGTWRYIQLKDFQKAQENLRSVWHTFSGYPFKENVLTYLKKTWDSLVG